MARPTKSGLDYFPLNVDIELDEKFEYITSRYGAAGYATFISVLCAIYRNGYYINWTETYSYILSKRVSVDKNTCSEIVSECINVGLFDGDLFASYGILTSHGIQIRYLQASERRAKVQIIREYSLLSEQELPKSKRISLISCAKDVSVCKNHRSAGVSVAETTSEEAKEATKTPKVKESKVNIDDDDDTRARARGGQADENDGDLAEVITLFSNNIHPITGEIEADTLKDLLNTYKKMWVTEAIKEAALHHGTSVQYIVRILEGWARDGFKAQKPKGGTRNAGRVTGDSRPHHVDTPGLRRLKEDMRWADEHQKFPWEVQSESGGSGETPAGHSAD